MIDWKWLILAVGVGVYLGYALAAILAVSAQAEKDARNNRQQGTGPRPRGGNRQQGNKETSETFATSVAEPTPLVMLGQGTYLRKYYGDDLNDQAAGLRKQVAASRQLRPMT